MNYFREDSPVLLTPTGKVAIVLLPLFFVLFIESMSLGLLFPILNSIIIDPITSFLPRNLSLGNRNLIYGITVGLFMICWFFGAAILGDMSDKIGRKKALVICLLGTFAGYMLAATAILFSSLALLLVSRMIAGFTAGSQPIAQAAIVDISNEGNKARNIGFIFFAIVLGFVAGPAIGGVLSDRYLVHWFSFATPLYFAAILSFINVLMLWWFFPETLRLQQKVQIKFQKALSIFISAFTQVRLRKLSIVLLVEVFGWSNYYAFIALFLFEHYHLNALHVAIFLMVLALGFSLSCAYLVDYLAKQYSLQKTIVIALALTASCVLVTLLVHTEFIAWICAFIIGAGGALAYSDLIVMFSNQVREDEQGWVMGVTGSVMALCFGLTALITGVVAELGPNIPLLLSFLGLSLSAILMALT
ncbi:MAG: MFS transporter [Gammaproteobacteria bacterium]|nr:MFS transporter [Gammaproteobacteria bacterium]